MEQSFIYTVIYYTDDHCPEQMLQCILKDKGIITIDHFKDVNNNKRVTVLLHMSGPEAFPFRYF